MTRRELLAGLVAQVAHLIREPRRSRGEEVDEVPLAKGFEIRGVLRQGGDVGVLAIGNSYLMPAPTLLPSSNNLVGSRVYYCLKEI